MDGMTSLAKVFIFIGIVIIILGGVILLISRFTGGKGMPGDIVIRRDHITIYIPIVTSIIVSIILTLIFSLLAAWRR